jgi:hypothetical protein
MFAYPPCTSKMLPREYRSAAEKLFPSGGFPAGKGPTVESAAAFAKILGISEDYRRLWDTHKSGQKSQDFLVHFQNNLDLLIQKTWVEKGDEKRKEDLQDQVPPFISFIENGDYVKALEEFGSILEELAYLFFSVQSQKEDFAEFVLRIDAQMGLFWWYGGQINSIKGASWVKNVDRNVIYALLLLGICYLTNF